MKKTLITAGVVVVLIVILTIYKQYLVSQVKPRTDSDIVVATSTTNDSIAATSTNADKVTNAAVLKKTKFDPYAPKIEFIPGIHGMETEDLTNLKYPACAAAKTRSETHPGELSLSGKTGFIVYEDNNYYNINGTNESQIYYEIWNCTIPLYGMDNGADAITESKMNYNYTYDNVGGQICNISNVAVGVHISYLLPKWVYASEASGPLLDIWNAYLVGITKHEDHHGSIAKDFGSRFYSYLNGLSMNHTCVQSPDTITTEFNQTINDLNAAQVKYDLDVDHGVKEGIFSPFNNI